MHMIHYYMYVCHSNGTLFLSVRRKKRKKQGRAGGRGSGQWPQIHWPWEMALVSKTLYRFLSVALLSMVVMK